eukprot:6189753-Pleurochrysis_carterae.AAC.1
MAAFASVFCKVPLRALYKGIRQRYEDMGKVCDSNQYSLTYICDRLSEGPADIDEQLSLA